MKKLPTLEEHIGKEKPEELKNLTDKEVLEVFKDVTTIWDIYPTKEELEAQGLFHFNKVDIFREYGYDKEVINAPIFQVLLDRDLEDEAMKFFNLIPNKEEYLYELNMYLNPNQL